MSFPVKNEPNTIPLHIVYVTLDSIDTDVDIFDFCKEKGIRFSSRLYDSEKYQHDRYEIYRLPAIHIYLKNVFQATVYPNEEPITSIESYITKYENVQKARSARAAWWRSHARKYSRLIGKIMRINKNEDVEIQPLDNPMHSV